MTSTPVTEFTPFQDLTVAIKYVNYPLGLEYFHLVFRKILLDNWDVIEDFAVVPCTTSHFDSSLTLELENLNIEEYF